MQKLFFAPLLALSLAAAPGCATKKFVQTEVGSTNAKVEALTRTIEEVQARVTQNEARIGQVDQKADAAANAAGAAGSAAAEAATRADTASLAARDASNRVEAAETAAKRLVYQVTLSESEGNFASGACDLSAKAKAHLDQVVGWLKQHPQVAYVEIEGHTDNVGPKAVNARLGEERAEAARQYIHDQFQMPLNKINVISYGAEKPEAPNTSAVGRSMNRRIVVRILS